MENNLDVNPSKVYLGMKRFHENWGSILFLGIVLVVLGALSIIGANIITLTTIVFFGLVLTIGGILQIIYAIWDRHGESFAQTLLSGIFYTIVGILMLTHANTTALAITLLFAAFFTVSGLYKIVYSISGPVIQWGWLLLSGLVSLALGLLIWSELPGAGLWVIGTFIGIDLIFVGWFWIMLSLAAKNLPIKP
jgi:uncharacterized membrane protein HdeD (DUF308 family)